MSSTTPMLFPVDPDVFWEQLRELIQTELKKASVNSKVPQIYEVPGLTQKPIFRAEELCDMLSITRQTLHTWVKEGVIKAYKIKSRLFFLKSDIDDLLKKQPK